MKQQPLQNVVKIRRVSQHSNNEKMMNLTIICEEDVQIHMETVFLWMFLPRYFMIWRKETMTLDMGWSWAEANPLFSALTIVLNASFNILRPILPLNPSHSTNAIVHHQSLQNPSISLISNHGEGFIQLDKYTYTHSQNDFGNYESHSYLYKT